MFKNVLSVCVSEIYRLKMWMQFTEAFYYDRHSIALSEERKITNFIFAEPACHQPVLDVFEQLN